MIDLSRPVMLQWDIPCNNRPVDPRLIFACPGLPLRGFLLGGKVKQHDHQ